ncbi:SDR family oxidoreductase [Solwaraspora sp. WMMD1047]|uniref:SDR family NAD(P)-dependent oxidoreductase n=1 Tax=Solwaraspora sp. WMMD1047 TaxID=3016102 RepID=UPI0024166541|nr:SDR family oxidoreductase [Solwaraspora sp. WMMD1047]MDG4828151.1 SDR family oxidoreductase [Solwaraspora sp. WMMD1047]
MDTEKGPLANKVALVTGGSRGIGAAIALGLARDGADVALTYLNRADRADRVVDQITALGRKAVAIAADNADPAAVTAAVDQTAGTLDRLDILVNNAGVFPYGSIEDTSLAELDHTLGVHVRGVFVATQAALRHLADGGRVINIGSCLVERVPYPGVALYAMSKSALVGLTRGLARDLGGRAITVNLVHPGSTDTEMNPADSTEAAAERDFIALGRYAEPAEVAATVRHLAGPGGRYITGASISVDGGFAA